MRRFFWPCLHREAQVTDQPFAPVIVGLCWLKNQIFVVPLVVPVPMLVVPFPLPLEPVWVVPLMPLGRPLLPMGLVSLGSITRVPALGLP